MRSFILFCCLVFLFTFTLCAQAQQDTNYYKKYNNRLIVTFYSTQRYYEIGFNQKYSSDSLAKTSINFKSTAPETFGFGVAYDKISIAYDYRTVQPDDITIFKTGYNKVNSLSLNLGGNHWILENSWRRFKGFYDNNTAQNFSGYDSTKPYFQNTSMQSSTFRSKFLIFSNYKRFAYKSAYGNMYRQMKSAATVLLSGNLYYQRLTSDTAFVPFYLRAYYGDIAHLNKVNTTGFSTCAGFAFNLVIFKRIFFNMTIAFGPDFQWRNSNTFDGQSAKSMYTTFSADSRFALGFNSRNLFITFYSANDINELKSNYWEIKQKYFSGGVSIGYRFKMKEFKALKEMKESKFYKLI
jgi:hypothetical protein